MTMMEKILVASVGAFHAGMLLGRWLRKGTGGERWTKD